MDAKSVSIVVPVFKTGPSIVKSIQKLIHGLSTITHEFEVLVVLDGEDQVTHELIAAIGHPYLKIFHYQQNKGKGFAVKFGMNFASGDIVGYIDGGNDIDVDSLINAIKIFKNTKSDLVYGSKKHKESVVEGYSKLRRFYTNTYNIFLKVLFGIQISDTQVGMKIYSREVIETILPKSIIDGFAFEIEMITLCKMNKFNNLVPAPVKISFGQASSATNLKAISKILIESIQTFLRFRIFNSRNILKSKSFTEKLLTVRML